MKCEVNEFQCPTCGHTITVQRWFDSKRPIACPSGCGETISDYKAVVIFDE